MNRVQSYTRLDGLNWVAGRTLLPILARWGADAGATVVDVGCGEMPFRHLVRCHTYIGVDRTAAGAAVRADACALPFATESADCIIACQMLGDLEQPDQLFAECARVLRDGGQMIVFETTAYPEHDMPYDYFRVMPAGLRALAGRHAIECVELVPVGGVFARIAMYCNGFVLGRVRGIRGLAPVGAGLIVAANLVLAGLDHLAPWPRLAPDYAARLVRRPRHEQALPNVGTAPGLQAQFPAYAV